jgi:hypothetical protein
MLARDFGELDVIAMMLLELERQAHASGWGEIPPTIFRVSRVDDPATVEHEVDLPPDLAELYKLSPFIFEGMLGDTFNEEFTRLVTATRHPLAQLMLKLRNPHPPVAHIFISEAWFSSDPDIFDKLPELTRTGRTLEDVPGSEEARYGVAVMGDHYVVTFRKRTEDDNVSVITSNDHVAHGGGLVQALRILHDSECAAYSPLSSSDAVEKLVHEVDAYLRKMTDKETERE